MGSDELSREQRCVSCIYEGETPIAYCRYHKEPDGKGATGSGLKDSGERIQYESGMVRDIDSNKPAYELMFPLHVPFNEQMLTRVAEHLRKGAEKYERRNWEKGDSPDEMERAQASALRHLIQWLTGESDEDHAAAAIINVIFAETMRFKIEQRAGNPRDAS